MQERKMRHKITGVENVGKENAALDTGSGKCGKGKCAQNCRGRKCRKGKCDTKSQGWKMRHKTAGVENVGNESVRKRPQHINQEIHLVTNLPLVQ